MIKYIGSKRALLPWIMDALPKFRNVRSVLDVFSGSARVGHGFKALGLQVIANDHNAYGATLAKCYVEANVDAVERDARNLISELNRVRGRPGYFTRTFCEESRFFQPKNGARVDAIRERIEAKGLDPVLKSVLLVSLMEAADRVDSTVGVQMAYLKQWASRSFNPLELRLPDVLPAARNGDCRAEQLDAVDFAATFDADLAYLDPPYNQHKYLGNYHIWETLVLWDHPEAYGVARKRVDCKTRTSLFNSKPRFEDAMKHLVSSLRCKSLLVSFSDEGYLSPEAMTAILSCRGPVQVLERPHARYVGARIGIYNPTGTKVGSVGNVRNREFLFLVGDLSTPARPAVKRPSKGPAIFTA